MVALPNICIVELEYTKLLDVVSELKNYYGNGPERRIDLVNLQGVVVHTTTIDNLYDAVVKKEMNNIMPGYITKTDGNSNPMVVMDPEFYYKEQNKKSQKERQMPSFMGKTNFKQRLKRARYKFQ